MSLTVTRAAVKAKLGLDTPALDAAIDGLIADWVPVIEFALEPSAVNDPTVGMIKTLDLGATEVVAGEFMAQLARTFGYFDSVKVGDFELRPFFRPNILDPTGLKEQGRRRLRPFLRTEAAHSFATLVWGTDGKAPEDDP